MLIDKLLENVSYDIGIDLGTANTMVYVKGKGILIREPSIVTIHKKTKEVLAVGGEAKRMFGKTPKNLISVRPLRDGVISDFHVAEKMLVYFMKRIHSMPSKRPILPKPRVVLGVPCGVTSVEKKAVIDAAKNAGARKAYLIEEPMAAAIGAGLPIEEPQGNMIVDMGGGTSEIAVISLGGIVVSRSLRVAGDVLDQALVNYARNKYNLLLGERTAEELKCVYGSAYEFMEELQLRAVLRGRDLKTGLPRSIDVSPKEIREALLPQVYDIIASIKDTIEETPAELVSDILKGGIVLAGGTALLRGLGRLVSHELKVPVKIAKDPITCVVRGCAKVLDDEALLRKVCL